MSLFDKIKTAIFGDHGPLGGQFSGNHPTAAAPAAPANPAAGAPPPIASAPTAAAPVAAPVDVEAVLTAKAAALGKPSNWRTSIVDLMILLGLDPSRENRTELAQELGYPGDVADSAAMNIWLHKQVMKKLAENGGTVPAALQ